MRQVVDKGEFLSQAPFEITSVRQYICAMTSREDILAVLRQHRPELERLGALHVALFGSQARADAGPASDIDVAVAFAPDAKRRGLAYFGLRQRLAERLTALLQAEVELSDEDLMRPEVRETYARDRLYAF
jgi:uncharacterized protein